MRTLLPLREAGKLERAGKHNLAVLGIVTFLRNPTPNHFKTQTKPFCQEQVSSGVDAPKILA